MLSSFFNAHTPLGTGTLGSFTEHLSAKTAKNKPCLRGSISQVLIKEVQGAVKEKEHNTDVRDKALLENTHTHREMMSCVREGWDNCSFIVFILNDHKNNICGFMQTGFKPAALPKKIW